MSWKTCVGVKQMQSNPRIMHMVHALLFFVVVRSLVWSILLILHILQGCFIGIDAVTVKQTWRILGKESQEYIFKDW